MISNTELRGSRRQQSTKGRLKNNGSIVYVVQKNREIDSRGF